MPTVAITNTSRARRDSPSGEPGRELKGAMVIGLAINLLPAGGHLMQQRRRDPTLRQLDLLWR